MQTGEKERKKTRKMAQIGFCIHSLADGLWKAQKEVKV
jgi:hypothetical protein